MLDSPTLSSPLDEATAILRHTFGHPAFRGLQAGVIEEVLAGRHALAVLPTGGGKSLCYQIPAIMRPGVAVIVSPLIALMADQVAGLQQSGVAAARLDSNIDSDERERIWRAIGEGGLDILYLSPEGLMQPSMLSRLAGRAKLSTNSRASRRRSSARMSARVRASAVAVTARRGACGNTSASRPSMR